MAQESALAWLGPAGGDPRLLAGNLTIQSETGLLTQRPDRPPWPGDCLGFLRTSSVGFACTLPKVTRRQPLWLNWSYHPRSEADEALVNVSSPPLGPRPWILVQGLNQSTYGSSL